MNILTQANPAVEKRQVINNLLSDYWCNDVWDIRDSIFDNLRPLKWTKSNKTIDFSAFHEPIRSEVKYMYVYKLQETHIKLTTVISYSSLFCHLTEFLNIFYPKLASFEVLPYNKAVIQWRSFLLSKGFKMNAEGKINSGSLEAILNQLYSFFVDFYDCRSEHEKDIWDCRKIPGAKITENVAHYSLDFTDIPIVFRELVKRFIKMRLTFISQSQCYHDIRGLRLFTKYIYKQEPLWKDLKMLTRKHMEDYLCWYYEYTSGRTRSRVDYLVSLRIFLEYLQRAMYVEAPDLPTSCLLFKEDMPKIPSITEENIKYIPEGVLQQLEDNLQYLTPSEYIPIIILLRASGWRISDILNLRYDTCLNHTSQGWYLCGDITKTKVLNHRIPITDEIYAVVKSVVDEVKAKSTDGNNPKKLLFVRFAGRRKGHCPQGKIIQAALNRFAKTQNIVDDQGNVFHFKNHAFRHTKGIELINNGMKLVHVQKWMAHVSPEMTLTYAKILDTTMRKSWEEATRQGLFRIDDAGKFQKVDISNIENEDVIEWEYIRHNLDAVRMPLGYCMKPKKQECHTQLNPCLTCRNLCTTPEFIPQYELEIQETKAVIEKGIAQKRSVWVEKNQALLERYESVLNILKSGKIHHKAGKKGREYTVEERTNE